MQNKMFNNIYEKKNNSFLELKTYKSGKIIGYASVFNLVDSYNDVVLPSAFKKSLEKNRNVKLLWQHDQSKPIGYITKLKEDSVGLYMEAQILDEVQQGRDAIAMIKNKMISGLSIGYNAISHSLNKNRQRLLEEVDLLEISIVTFPANKLAKINYCKF